MSLPQSKFSFNPTDMKNSMARVKLMADNEIDDDDDDDDEDDDDVQHMHRVG